MKVDIIEFRGQAAVVEWESDGCPHRAIVPREAISGNECDPGILGRGIPFGADWAAAIGEAMPSAEDVACSLRRFNIWTGDDLRAQMKMARLAILTAFGEALAEMLRDTNPKAQEAMRHAANRD